MKKMVSLLLVGLFLASCSSTTLINTNDKDVKIYIDGEYKGRGTASHTDTKIVGSTTSVMLKKKGCAPRSYTFSRSEVFDAGACAGGVFVLVPFLWVMKYKAARTYEFECDKD